MAASSSVGSASASSTGPVSLGLATRAWRAALVAGVWGIGVLPPVFARTGCLFARIFRYPCPGCGMTRAMTMLLRGDVAGSLRMHPFALPVLITTAALALASVWITFTLGSPFVMWRTRVGRATIVALAAVDVVVVAFWVLRALGCFGGPVPVY